MLNQPHEREAMARATRSPATLAAVGTGIDRDLCEQFIRSCEALVRANEARLRNRQVAFVLDATAASGSRRLSMSLINQCLTSGHPRIVVAADLSFVRCDEAVLRLFESQERTRHEKSVELVFSGTYAVYVVAGVVVFDADVVRPERELPVASPFRRPLAEFDAILADHSEDVLRSERGLTYWYDKKNRVLLANPDKTEKIFHRSLFRWLDNNVADALRDFGETRGLGQDATDITVVTPSGSCAIEVKWLGTNENGQDCGEITITQGLKQVSLYLERDPDLIGGYLVCYDGRSADDNREHCFYDASVMHVDCEHPKVIFLESETPSQTARRIHTSRRKASG